MRPLFFATAVCFFLLLSGCAGQDEMKFSKGSGEVGVFILKKATDFGGHPSTTNYTSRIETSWHYAEDQEGVVIRMDPKACASVETLLLQSFKEPRVVPTENPEGIRCLVYRLTAKGGGIQMFCDSNYTQIIILKPRNPSQPVTTN